MRRNDFEDFGNMPESEFLRRKRPAVFIYEAVVTERVVHEIRVGCGWHDAPLPAFRIPFTTPYGDYVMVSNPDAPHSSRSEPSSVLPSASSRNQEEMAL